MKADKQRVTSRTLVATLAALIAMSGTIPLVLHAGLLERRMAAVPVEAASADRFVVTAPVRLGSQPKIVIESGTLSLLPERTFFRRSEGPYDILASGRGHILLADARIVLDQSESNPSAPGTSESAVSDPFLDALRSLDFKTLKVENSTLVVKKVRGEETLEVTSAEIKSGHEDYLRGSGHVRLRGEALDWDVTLAVGGASNRGRSIPVKAHLAGSLVDADLDAQLMLGPHLSITAGSARLALPRLSDAARWLGVAWPADAGPQAFAVEGPLEWSDGQLAFDAARIEIDGNKAKGGLALQTTSGRPNITGTLAFDRLEIAPYLGQDNGHAIDFLMGSSVMSAFNLAGTSRGSLIRELDTDLRLSAASVAVDGEPLGRGAATLSVRDGVLQAELAEIEPIDGGSGLATITIDRRGAVPALVLRGNLSGFEVGRLATALTGTSMLQGSGNVLFDLTGHGEGTEDVLETLAGSINLEMAQGGRIGVDMPALTAAVGTGEKVGWGIAPGGTTFDSLTVRLKAKDGTLTADGVTARAADREFTAAGSISSANRTLDVVLVGRGGPPSVGRTGGGVGPQTVLIRGSWLNPSIRRQSGPVGKSASAEDGSGGTSPGTTEAGAR